MTLFCLYIGGETYTLKQLPYKVQNSLIIGLLLFLQYLFGNKFSNSLLIGNPSLYRGFLILAVFETCRSIFNLTIWTISLLHSIRSHIKLFTIPFTAVFLLSIFGIPILGIPYELFCLLAIQRYALSKRDLPQLSLLIVSLPFIAVNLVVWVKNAGWENSYSLWNHLIGILYASVFYPNDDRKKHILLIWEKKWQHRILNIFGWISLLIGWQHPYGCFALVHVQLLLLQILRSRFNSRDG